MRAFLTWFDRDAWGPLWPNLVANLMWVSPAFVLHHLLIRRHIIATVAAVIPAPSEDVAQQLREMRADLAVIHEIAEQFEQLRDQVNEHINLCHDHPLECP